LSDPGALRDATSCGWAERQHPAPASVGLRCCQSDILKLMGMGPPPLGEAFANLRVLRSKRLLRIPPAFVCKGTPQKVALMQELLGRRRRGAAVKIGYRRVSGLRIGNETFKLKSPKMAGCQKIFRERFPASIGATRIPTYARQIRPGDVIVIWKLDRLARSRRDLLNSMETVHEAGGNFQSISEPWANTTTHVGKMGYRTHVQRP